MISKNELITFFMVDNFIFNYCKKRFVSKKENVPQELLPMVYKCTQYDLSVR